MTKQKQKLKVRNSIRAKIVLAMTLIVGIGFAWKLCIQLLDNIKLKKQAELVEQELAALEDENASLVSTRNKLEDPDYVATYARGEYMFSMGDEKVFYLLGDTEDEEK